MVLNIYQAILFLKKRKKEKKIFFSNKRIKLLNKKLKYYDYQWYDYYLVLLSLNYYDYYDDYDDYFSLMIERHRRCSQNKRTSTFSK